MTQEEKDILLKYLCMALPYGVCAKLPNHHLVEHVYKIEKINMRGGWTDGILNSAGKQRIYSAKIEDIRPYLRPMSSMTEEEREQYNTLCDLCEFYDELGRWTNVYYDTVESFGFLLANHFDFMRLIPMSIAIEVTDKNNPYKD